MAPIIPGNAEVVSVTKLLKASSKVSSAAKRKSMKKHQTFYALTHFKRFLCKKRKKVSINLYHI
jgi:hypothetical protein